MLRELIDRAWAAVPAQCAACRSWPAQPVCDACVARFAQPEPRCETCALPVPEGVRRCGECTLTPPPLDRCLAAVHYGYPWSSCITQFKFNGQPGWAGALATLMRSTPWVEPALEAADLVLPMPLSAQRLAQRGFNQAQLLAQRLAPARLRTGLLLRIRDTSAQSALDRRERIANVRGAFAVEPLAAPALAGRRVVLVDDVMTSGATLFAAAQVLRAAGADHVTAVVLARTPAPE